jgi:hypothetical protein
LDLRNNWCYSSFLQCWWSFLHIFILRDNVGEPFFIFWFRNIAGDSFFIFPERGRILEILFSFF